MQIAEMVEYSPTLKYSKTGMYVTEGSEHAKKPLGENKNDDCAPYQPAYNEWQKHYKKTVSDKLTVTGNSTVEKDGTISLKCKLIDENNNPVPHKMVNFYIDDMIPEAEQDALTVSNTWINRDTTQLPMPLTDVYIFFDNEFAILYNQLSTELSYTKGDFVFEFEEYNKDFDTVLKWVTDDSKISLKYDRDTTPLDVARTSQDSENRDPDDLSLSTLFKAELKLFNIYEKKFTTGINNSFSLRLQNAYGIPITIGEVECSIWTSNQETNTPCSDAYKCLGTHTPDANGVIEFKKLNFRKLKPSRNTYYLRIKYRHKCYEKDITKWKELKFEEEHINMDIYANNSLKGECTTIQTCLTSVNKCCEHRASSHFIDNEYNQTYSMQHINSVDELPLRLDVVLRSQPLYSGHSGNIVDEGYCELSVNDKVVQTTFVNSQGVADFYLDEYDVDPGLQIIKIEYFNSPNDTINYAYFPLKCDTDEGYSELPAIPISINKITTDAITQLTSGIYEVPVDEIFFCNVDTSKNDYRCSVTIKKDNEEEVHNIPANAEDDFIITATYNNKPTETYTIITGNAKKSDGTDDNDNYRTTKKEFTIKWVNN